jgi:hypothetical protein
MTSGMAKRGNWRMSYEQVNPKMPGGASYHRFEGYKESTSFEEAGEKGASSADFAWDFPRGFCACVIPHLSRATSLGR